MEDLDKEAKDAAPQGACDAVTSGCRLLSRNPQLSKVLLASGLQMAAANLPDTFVLSLLRARIWGNNMSEYMSIAAIGINSVAVFFGGPFGRFSDCVDRRLAAAVFALGTFAPGWALMIFGSNARGLWISTVVKVVGSYGLTSNVMLALINDVTAAEDREEAVGAYFAANNFMSLAMTGIPVMLVLVLKVIPNSPVFFLAMQAVLSALCLLLLFWVQMEGKPHEVKKEPVERESEVEEDSRQETHSSVSSDQDWRNPDACCAHCQSTSGSRSCGLCSDGSSLRAMARQFILPIRLAFGERRLRRLWFAAFLLMFAGQLVMDIGGQFFNQSMGLIPYGTRQEIITVAVLTMIPGQLLAIPGNLITGYLSKRGGPLFLLRRMIPLASFLVTVGALMAEVRQMWFIAVVVICLNHAGLPNVPLMRMASGVAPPGRVGEALSSMGIAAQLASLIGNIAVAVLNRWLMKSDLYDPLWIYYPVCGTLSLCAILPLTGTPRGGWGAASGVLEDQFMAVIYAHRAQKRWRKQVALRKAERAQA